MRQETPGLLPFLPGRGLSRLGLFLPALLPPRSGRGPGCSLLCAGHPPPPRGSCQAAHALCLSAVRRQQRGPVRALLWPPKVLPKGDLRRPPAGSGDLSSAWDRWGTLLWDSAGGSRPARGGKGAAIRTLLRGYMGSGLWVDGLPKRLGVGWGEAPSARRPGSAAR